jgi:acyl carrier protein
MNTRAVEDRLIEFLQTLTGNTEIAAGTDLLEGGIVDSLTMMDLMVFIESELKVQLETGDLNADVFRTPATLAQFIVKRRGQPRSAASAV